MVQRDLTLLTRRSVTPVRYLRLLIAGLVIAAITSAPAKAAPNPPIAPPAGKTWTLGLDVEFGGTSLDTTKLTPCFDWNTGQCTSSFNNGKEHYLPSQIQLSNGVAHLVAEPLTPPYSDSACYNGLCTYKSGLLSTARPDQSSPYLFSFTYGYVESRLKLPTTPGMFTAFWMLPTNPTYQYDDEIDILESVGGKPDVIYQTYHYGDRNSHYKVNDVSKDTNGNCAKVDYSSAFHTYGVDWQPDHVAFYIDGTQCGSFIATDPGQIENEPMQIILDLMVDTKWQRDANLVLPSQTVTDHLDVDYLKVWQAQ
jgi:beta-glucanase (GH16 family)